MNIKTIIGDHYEIAVVEENSVIIHDVQSAIDLIADILYGKRIDNIVLKGTNFTKEFFDLKTGLLGGIIQKFSNYSVRVVIVGDLDKYRTKSFCDFVYESNNGRTLFFVLTEEEAIKKLNAFK